MKRVVLSVCAAVAAAVSAWGDSYVWVGDGDGKWETPGNWRIGEDTPESKPGENDDVTIPSGANPVTVYEAFTVQSLTVGSGEGASVTVTFRHAGENHVKGNCLLEGAAFLTHEASGTAYAVNLKVDGNLTLAANAKINVDGKGYVKSNSPAGSVVAAWGSYSVAAHGGYGYCDTAQGASYGDRVDNNGGKTYGSIRFPFKAGAGGQSSAGGGRVKLTVGGVLTVNGIVSANGAGTGTTGGAGGSVWVTAASLAGGGTIAASESAGGGGGGRVAVKLTDRLADFVTTWTGHIVAYGGGAGTVYEQTGAQEDGFGTLIIDAGSPTAVSRTPISEGVTETDVGDLIVRNKAVFQVHKNATLTVNGSITITNGAAFSSMQGSMLELASTNDCRFFGTATPDLYAVSCEVPGKRVLFGDNFTMKVKSGGSITLKGSREKPLEVLPQNGAAWKLTVGNDAAIDVAYVAVSNCNSKEGLAITDWDGVDLGGNVNWSCVPYPIIGDTNVWTGADSTDCMAKDNWSLGRLPIETDVIRISASATKMPVLTAAETTWNRLIVDEGATFTFQGATQLSVTNGCEVYGTLALPGTRQLNLVGDVTFGPNAVLTPDNSRVTLVGSAPRTVRSAGVRFHRLELDETCGDVAFADGFEANVFRSRRPLVARLVTFAKDASYVWEEGFLDGRLGDGRGLTLAASEPGGTWNLTVERFALVRCANVSGCVANGTGSAGVRAFGCAGTGENPGWSFDAPRSFFWKDESSGTFATDENWEGGVAPSAGDVAYLVEAAGKVTMDAATTLGELVVGGGEAAVTLQSSAALDVAGDIRVADAGTLVLNKPTSAGGNLSVYRGGVITHTQSAADYAVELAVSGSIAVDVQGSIHADGKGYAASQGPVGSTAAGWGGYSVAAHGGFGETDVGYETRVDDNGGKTYGSVRHPFEAGAGGNSSAGGGRVKLMVVGALTVDGIVSANGAGSGNTAGAGGSVWVTAASLAGSGTVAADGNGGGGGRVAVKLTDKLADFVTTWDGKITAYGSGAGTVYEQTGAQADGLGTLIIDGGNLSKVGRTILAPYVTDQEAGEVIVRNNAKLEVRGANRKVSRFWRLSVDTGAVSVKIAEPIVLGDLDLRVSGSILSIGANKVTVRSRLHKDGRGWAKGWKISTAVDPASGEPGCVEWKCPGSMLIIQ